MRLPFSREVGRRCPEGADEGHLLFAIRYSLPRGCDDLSANSHYRGFGAGVTSLGAALPDRLNAVRLDTDDFYWLPTSPPHRFKRDVTERLALLDTAPANAGRWVLSGSCDAWIGCRLLRSGGVSL